MIVLAAVFRFSYWSQNKVQLEMKMKEKEPMSDRYPESALKLDVVLEPAVEELEAKVAPDALGVKLNHNETLLQDYA